MAIKLRDVAAKAGVSISTVSNVLNGYTKSGIKRETCEKVLKIANDMGYRPNAIARSLRYQRSNTVGFYTAYGFRDAREPFIGSVYAGMQIACDEHHLDFLVHGNLDSRDPLVLKPKLTDGRIDGIVIHAPVDDPVVKSLADGVLPAVGIADRQTVIPSIVPDEEYGVRLIVEYLWERGHRRMVFLDSTIYLDSVKRRAIEFQKYLKELGGEPAIKVFPYDDLEEYIKELMNDSKRPTAVLCWQDTSAYKFIQQCMNMGIRMPEDLAVTGFDGLLERRLPARRLVTVSIPWEEMALEAVRTILKIRDGEVIRDIKPFPVSIFEGDTA